MWQEKDTHSSPLLLGRPFGLLSEWVCAMRFSHMCQPVSMYLLCLLNNPNMPKKGNGVGCFFLHTLSTIIIVRESERKLIDHLAQAHTAYLHSSCAICLPNLSCKSCPSCMCWCLQIQWVCFLAWGFKSSKRARLRVMVLFPTGAHHPLSRWGQIMQLEKVISTSAPSSLLLLNIQNSGL